MRFFGACIPSRKSRKFPAFTPGAGREARRGSRLDGGNTQQVHYLGINDDKGRLMAIICHNTDLGDGWEREGESEEYFREFSEKKSYPMGINIVTYAMTTNGKEVSHPTLSFQTLWSAARKERSCPKTSMPMKMSAWPSRKSTRAAAGSSVSSPRSSSARRRRRINF